jgi:hypothetical protein
MKCLHWKRKLITTLAAAGLLAPSTVRAAELNVNLVANASFESTAEVFPGSGPFGSMLLNTWVDADGDNDDAFVFPYTLAYAGIPDPPSAGDNFYTGGFNTTAGAVLIKQSFSVGTGPSGTLIQSGNAKFDLSGYFTSYADGDDASAVRAIFLNTGGSSLGQVDVGGYNFIQSLPITDGRRDWGQARQIGDIPIGTSTVEIQVISSDADGNHDGYVDLIDFQVTNNPVLTTLDLTVNRADGSILLRNRTAAPVTMNSYTISSTDGGLNPSNWASIADTGDSNSGGSVDNQHVWNESSGPTDPTMLSEAGVGGGALLAVGRVVSLGTGAWLRNPTEDVRFTYNTSAGTQTGFVNYIGHNGVPFDLGDFNADSQINAADWMILRGNQLGNLNGLSPIQAYLRGDLSGDFRNDHADFILFRDVYDLRNGPGSFAAMVASIPEPASLGFMAWISIVGLAMIRRKRN